jgi:hypothetical protein
MLPEVAERTGLSAQVTAALADTYRDPWSCVPGVVFVDLAAGVADGTDCIDGVGQACGDREHVFGVTASTTTMWRLLDGSHLPGIRAARAHARAAAWAAGAAPVAGQLHLDVRPSLSTIPRTKSRRGRPGRNLRSPPLLAFLDCPDIAAGEALAGLLRPGNTGSNTAAEHVRVLGRALESLPAAYRPNEDPAGQQILGRCDSAGATHTFAAGVRVCGRPAARSR